MHQHGCFLQSTSDEFEAIVDMLPDAIGIHDVHVDQWGVVTDLSLSWWNAVFQERRIRPVVRGDLLSQTYFCPHGALSYVNRAWETGEAIQVFHLDEDTKPFYTYSDQGIDVVVTWRRIGQHIVESSSSIKEVLMLRDFVQDQESLVAIASRKRVMAIERERIARNLHDVVIQNLYATSISLSLAGKRAGAEVEAEFNRAIAALENIINEIRNEILDLESQKSSQLRLRLEDTLIPILNPTNAEFDLFIEVPTLPNDVQEHIRAVCLEATSNAVRHGGATRIRIRISRHGDNLYLTVGDNGTGIPEHYKQQNGLHNLRERAKSLGGKMEIQKNGQNGTTISWSIPYPRWKS
ncbi:MAG: hypothetical protein RIR69_898 [Actinomycetota bacterium]|jgi:signal transduction histidine kinase